MQSYQEGDAEAFREFFDRTKVLAFKFILMHLKNQADTEDVFQDTYFRLHRYIMGFDSQRNALIWLLSIARNALKDKVKGNRLVPLDQANLDGLIATETADENLNLRELLGELFQDLDPGEISLVADRFFSDHSYEEIAQNSGTTTMNARKKISRILKKIKSRWTQST